MINTVLGEIKKEDLGETRVHEHILWDWIPETQKNYNRKTVIDSMLPYLVELEARGCKTLLEATPKGAGRNIEVLQELSEKSKLNIICNSGVWDGLNYNGKYVPQEMKNKSSDQIAEEWINEYKYGIEGTNVKPGFIKIGLGDNDFTSDFQMRFLKAAVYTSQQTGLPIVSHICSSKSAKTIANLIISENLEPKKFVWSHADYPYDTDTIIELAKLGIWIELSWHIGQTNTYNWYIDLINKMNELNLLNRLLVSQDAGGFHKGNIVSYRKFYTDFIDGALKNKVKPEIINNLLIVNPANMLDY